MKDSDENLIWELSGNFKFQVSKDGSYEVNIKNMVTEERHGKFILVYDTDAEFGKKIEFTFNAKLLKRAMKFCIGQALKVQREIDEHTENLLKY